MNITELEETLLDQIEKLSDDSIMENEPEKVQQMIERSKVMSDLTKSYMDIERHKLDVVKTVSEFGSYKQAEEYKDFLGVGLKKSKRLTDGRAEK